MKELVMNKVIAAAVVALAGCAGAGEKVVVNGVEGIRIVPVAMIGTLKPTPENLEYGSQRIKTGDHRGGFISNAARTCPNGHTVLEEGEPEARIFVSSPYVQYRVRQPFVIKCN